MKTVKIIGMGLSPQDLTAEHLRIIETADILVGGKRLLKHFADCRAQKKSIDKNIDGIIEFIKDRMATRSIVVLASGDPLFFGIGARLVKALGAENVVIFPNVSAVAAAFARIKEPWSNVRVVSLHGRDDARALFKALETENVVAVFTDPQNNPARLAQRLIEEELTHFSLCVLESLGTSGERFNWHRPYQAAAMTFAEPNLVILKKGAAGQKPETTALPWDAGQLLRSPGGADHKIGDSRYYPVKTAAVKGPHSVGPGGRQRVGIH